MVYGAWSIVYGLWCMVYGVWFTWFMVYDPQYMVDGLGSRVWGLEFMVYGFPRQTPTHTSTMPITTIAKSQRCVIFLECSLKLSPS